MQKVNKSSVKKGAALCLAMAMACTAFVGCGKKDDAASASGATSESAVEVLDNSKLTEMPDGVSLSEDQMKTTMNAYAAYMTEALASDGYTVTVRYDEDGSVHFDGTKTADDGSTVEVPDLSKFDNLSAAFAYLYNCGQADAEGNLLVATSVPAEEAAASRLRALLNLKLLTVRLPTARLKAPRLMAMPPNPLRRLPLRILPRLILLLSPRPLLTKLQ